MVPLERQLLELNVERQTLASEQDKLLQKRAGLKTRADRVRAGEVEKRLDQIDRECAALRGEIRRTQSPARTRG